MYWQEAVSTQVRIAQTEALNYVCALLAGVAQLVTPILASGIGRLLYAGQQLTPASSPSPG